jgi:oligopeptide transport system ATP-binding protein
VTSLAIMRLVPQVPACHIEGSVKFRPGGAGSTDLLTLAAGEMRKIRGGKISMIFQEPMTSLNPVHKVGAQVAESILQHERIGRRAALARAAELFELVGIPEPKKRLEDFPHHLSGGMRQRVMIAMAIACNPKILIADEPTTALDVSIQAQILDLLRRLQDQTRMGIIFITHNLGVVAEIADRVLVMYAGRVVEVANAETLFDMPLMPYTKGLLQSVPSLDMLERRRLAGIPGGMPDPLALPPGCVFHPRCPHVDRGRCDSRQPVLDQADHDHFVRCLRWNEIAS